MRYAAAAAALAGYATEPSKVELALEAGELLRVNPAWEPVHNLPHPAFMSAEAAREVPPGDLLFAAGMAYRRAPEGWRDEVGFEVEVVGRRARLVGATVRTLDDPVEGRCHIIILGFEERGES